MASDPQPLTELAQRYGHPVGMLNKPLAFTGKSGLTPLPPLTPTADSGRRIALEGYQRVRFLDFTAEELVDLKAWAPLHESQGYKVTELTDDLPVHPIFARRNWLTHNSKSLGRHPLPGGKDGFWHAGNDKVWELLRPALGFASQVLFNCECNTWFQALLLGELTPIMNNVPDQWKNGDLLRLRLPRGFRITFGDANKQMQAALIKSLTGVTFDLTSSFINDWTGLGVTGLGQNARVANARRGRGGTVTVFLGFEMLLPLLRNGLTLAERKVESFYIGVSLLHEVHAIWMNGSMSKDLNFGPGEPEPYYDRDCLTELGYSMEHHVFGGLAQQINAQWEIGGFGVGTGNPSAGIVCANWLNMEWEHYHDQSGHTTGIPPVIPPLPNNWTQQEFWPVPVFWIEDMHSPIFWNTNAKRFRDVTKMGPKTLASARFYTKDGRQDGHIDLLSSFTPAMTTPDPKLSAFENMRRKRLRGIGRAIIFGRQKRKQARVGWEARHAPALATPKEPTGFLAAIFTPYKDKAPTVPTPAATGIGSEYDMGLVEPDIPAPCPRFDEILTFLLKNRSQNHLCLDTMPQSGFPDFTLWNHIIMFSHDLANIVAGRALQPDLTPEEWRAFLHQCNFRWKVNSPEELFMYRTYGPGGFNGGQIEWFKRPAPGYPVGDDPSDRVRNSPPADPRLVAVFRAYCLQNSDWYFWYGTDIYLEDLVEEVNANGVMEGSGRTFTEGEVRGIIDHFERQMDLFCWGPNGVVRRLVDTWPLPTAGPDFYAPVPSPSTTPAQTPFRTPVSTTRTGRTSVNTPATSVGDDDDGFEMIFLPTES